MKDRRSSNLLPERAGGSSSPLLDVLRMAAEAAAFDLPSPAERSALSRRRGGGSSSPLLDAKDGGGNRRTHFF